MKLLSLIILLVCALCIAAQHNYTNAIRAATGTDAEIEATMKQYGFNVAWYEDITMIDKIKAITHTKNT